MSQASGRLPGTGGKYIGTGALDMEGVLEFLQTNWYWILVAIVGIIIVLKFIPRYKIAPPDKALIISGLITRGI